MLHKKNNSSKFPILQFGITLIVILGIFQSLIPGQAGLVPSPYFEYTPYLLNVRAGEQYNYSGTYYANMTGTVISSGSSMPMESHQITSNFTDSYSILDVNNYSSQLKYQKSHMEAIMEKLFKEGQEYTANSAEHTVQNHTIQYDNKYDTYFNDPFVLTQNLTFNAITNHSYMFNSQSVNHFLGFLANDQNQIESGFDGALMVHEIIDSDSIRVNISNVTGDWANWRYAHLFFSANTNHSKLIFRIQEIISVSSDILEFTVENNPTQPQLHNCNISLNEMATIIFGFNFYDRTTIIGKGLEDNVLIVQGATNLDLWKNNGLWLFPSASSSIPSGRYCIENITHIEAISFIYLDRPIEISDFDTEAWIVEPWDRDYPIYQSQLLQIFTSDNMVQISKPVNGNPNFIINQYIACPSEENYRMYYIKSVEEGNDLAGDYWNITLYNMWDFTLQINDNLSIFSRNEILIQKYDLAQTENQNEGQIMDFSEGLHQAYTKALFSHSVPAEDMPIYSGNKSDFLYAYQKTFSHSGSPYIYPMGVGIGVFSEDSALHLKMNEKFVISEILLRVFIMLNATFGDYQIIYRIEMEYARNLTSANYIPLPIPSNPTPTLPTNSTTNTTTNTTSNQTALPLGVLIGGGVIIFGASSGGTTVFLALYYRKRLATLKKSISDETTVQSNAAAVFGVQSVQKYPHLYSAILGMAGLITAIGLSLAFFVGMDATDLPWFGFGTISNLTLGENWILFICTIIGLSFILIAGLVVSGHQIFESKKRQISPLIHSIKDQLIADSIHELRESYQIPSKFALIATDIATFTQPFLQKITPAYAGLYLYLAAELLQDPINAEMIWANSHFNHEMRNELLHIISLCQQNHFSPKLTNLQEVL